MTPEQYTDDAVCFAMGLGPFVPTVAGDVIRLVCRPSHHPEVCVTITPDEIVTVALRSMLWPEPLPARMPEISQNAPLSSGDFGSISAQLDEALAASKLPPEWIGITDGMTASAVAIRGGRTDHHSSRIVNEEERALTRSILSLALSRAQSIELRNRISWCGWYVSHPHHPDFPVVAEHLQLQPRVSRVLVMGSPEDRADFHALHGAKTTPRRNS